MKFPDSVQHDIGFALMTAQFGGKHEDAKPRRGCSGASVLEVIENTAR